MRTRSWASAMASPNQVSVYQSINQLTHQRYSIYSTCFSVFLVVSAEVEMTAYGLLTYALLGDVASALPVVKWLSKQRNALGGFSSTQVTNLLHFSILGHEQKIIGQSDVCVLLLFIVQYTTHKFSVCPQQSTSVQMMYPTMQCI